MKVTFLLVGVAGAACVVELPGIVEGYVSTQVDFLSPNHLSKHFETPAMVLEVLLLPQTLSASMVQLCISVDGGPPSCQQLASFSFQLEQLEPGHHSLEAYVATQGGDRIDCHLPEHDTVLFEILQPRVVVSAANQPYFNRLSNLVGSLQYWEPGLAIRVYDLGLAAHQRHAVATTWTDVTVHSLDDSLPSHVRDEPALVGWKAFVILDTLSATKNRTHVLWLDANYEVRRPLVDIFDAISAKGYFLTVAGHRFPTGKTTRQATLDYLGCDNASFAEFAECTSAVIGVKPESLFHSSVLPAVNACSMRRDCLYPADAIENTNQRRDQSALNAALCGGGGGGNFPPTVFKCDPDRRFWMWHGQKSFLPTEDPYRFNEMVLFSRRGHAQVYLPS